MIKKKIVNQNHIPAKICTKKQIEWIRITFIFYLE